MMIPSPASIPFNVSFDKKPKIYGLKELADDLNKRVFPEAVEEMVNEFAHLFRKNLKAAMNGASWATAGWRAHSEAYRRIKKRKGWRRGFWRASGFLGRHMNFHKRKLSTQKTKGSVTIDLMEGIPINAIYPNTKGRTTTTDVFAYNEFGSKNQRPPARPVLNPAYWRTLQMFQMDECIIKAIQKRL